MSWLRAPWLLLACATCSPAAGARASASTPSLPVVHEAALVAPPTDVAVDGGVTAALGAPVADNASSDLADDPVAGETAAEVRTYRHWTISRGRQLLTTYSLHVGPSRVRLRIKVRSLAPFQELDVGAPPYPYELEALWPPPRVGTFTGDRIGPNAFKLVADKVPEDFLAPQLALDCTDTHIKPSPAHAGVWVKSFRYPGAKATDKRYQYDQATLVPRGEQEVSAWTCKAVWGPSKPAPVDDEPLVFAAPTTDSPGVERRGPGYAWIPLDWGEPLPAAGNGSSTQPLNDGSEAPRTGLGTYRELVVPAGGPRAALRRVTWALAGGPSPMLTASIEKPTPRDDEPLWDFRRAIPDQDDYRWSKETTKRHVGTLADGGMSFSVQSHDESGRLELRCRSTQVAIRQPNAVAIATARGVLPRDLRSASDGPPAAWQWRWMPPETDTVGAYVCERRAGEVSSGRALVFPANGRSIEWIDRGDGADGSLRWVRSP